MDFFEEHAEVTLAKPVPKGMLRLFGQVTGHATDPFTGQRQVMVLWPGAAKPLPYDPDELALAD
ncbi:hypothetical protein [Streptomyces roseochromogenus]|uniref:Uncharacterized protein n=1 Tax=Streptomyces roseochromogenus subsp. oscitans DS 12.976 TaxID=1352936 RepID=V6K4D2_STRRC|nr:hypothetical protein [Streptomyces roseochromogenus]EST26992.1 hypothetical protein M878_26220 [Streptomyces roseochromogenus subsp. oscitans DS 12.976]